MNIHRRAATRLRLDECALNDDPYLHTGTDGVLWGHDFGHKSGPFVDPVMFRDCFLDANRTRVAQMHRRGVAVLKHCCGNTTALLDMFVEIGYDAYQSIQPTAGMDICEIKKSHGDRLTLWGGVAVEHLVDGTMDEVRADVRRAMACAKHGGRFILGSSHSIAVGTKYDNVMAMIDEYHKRCNY
jgi:uroporphyrinogen-III decarboxylase